MDHHESECTICSLSLSQELKVPSYTRTLDVLIHFKVLACSCQGLNSYENIAILWRMLQLFTAFRMELNGSVSIQVEVDDKEIYILGNS
jgi:hypothetical protein